MASKHSEMIGDLQTVDELIEVLLSERKRLAQNEPDARENLISTARELVSNLETPLEAMGWINWAEVRQTLCTTA